MHCMRELAGRNEGHLFRSGDVNGHRTCGSPVSGGRSGCYSNSRERIMLACRDSVTALRRESAVDKPCTCIVRLRGRHTERARVGTD